MELPARFELATGFHEICDFTETLRPQIEIDEVASFASYQTKKLRSFHFGVSLELLARFELATRFHGICNAVEALRPPD